VVKARTGTGKTAAFGIPLVEGLRSSGHAPRALILTPTRELALQISREIISLTAGPCPRITAVYGGAPIRGQILDLKRGTEIVVGTPGRIMDLMERKILDLQAVEWFILDEADEMLDMGFFEDVETIMRAVKGSETELRCRVALFSATMPEAILKVIREYIGEAEILEDTAPQDEKPAVDQYYMILRREERLEALRRIIDGAEDFYGLVFCATKTGTDELARRLVEGGYAAEAIHGDLSQEGRERTLRRFRQRQTKILVATDVAARGLDIERLTHVVNWDLPNDRDTYVHRIGRTGRAGRRGKALSLALPAERAKIGHFSRAMEKVLGSAIVWTRVPSVKTVMKALRNRIVQAVTAALPDEPPPETILPAALPAGAGPGVPAREGPETAALPPEDGTGIEAGAVAGPAADTLPPETGVLPPAAGVGIGTGAAAALTMTAGGETPAAKDESSPWLAKVCCQLIERLGAERAVEALITANYGEMLDPSRYGTVTDFSEEDFPDSGRSRFGRGFGRERGPGRDRGPGRAGARGGHGGYAAGGNRHPGSGGFGGAARHAGFDGLSDAGDRTAIRVYVGLGRRHGANARDVAGLLMRAGGVPGRLVDEIEMKDYCAFATLPADAANRAVDFSRNTPGDPVIRPASQRKL
jgi:ATP-dependent RNA helicase DeaD